MSPKIENIRTQFEGSDEDVHRLQQALRAAGFSTRAVYRSVAQDDLVAWTSAGINDVMTIADRVGAMCPVIHTVGSTMKFLDGDVASSEDVEQARADSRSDMSDFAQELKQHIESLVT